MITAAIICPDSDVREQLLEKIAEHGRVYVVRKFEHYPYEKELVNFLRAAAPDVIFVSIESLDRATCVCAEIEAYTRRTQMIAVHRNCDVNMLLQVMHNGVRHFLTVPLAMDRLRTALARVSDMLERKGTAPVQNGEVYSFLPAKPGSGASTIAANTACALARHPDSRALLLDFDLNLGTLRYLLRTDCYRTLTEVAEKAAQLDEREWPELIGRVERLHLLPSGKLDTGAWLEPIQVQHLLEFSKRMYRHVCVDHSGNMEKYSIELLRESKRIFLVCDSDRASMRLAKQKIEFLRDQELGDTLTVVLNRTCREDSTAVIDVEDAIEAKVAAVVPYDRQTLQTALKTGVPVPERSEFGKACEQLAQMIHRPVRAHSPAKRFIEFFTLSRASA